MKHIEEGIKCLEQDSHSVLIFSGFVANFCQPRARNLRISDTTDGYGDFRGATKKERTEMTEGQSYRAGNGECYPL